MAPRGHRGRGLPFALLARDMQTAIESQTLEYHAVATSDQAMSLEDMG